MAQPDRPQIDNIIRRMRVTCWITKATYTLRICNTFCSSTAILVTRTRLNVHCLTWYNAILVSQFLVLLLLLFHAVKSKTVYRW